MSSLHSAITAVTQNIPLFLRVPAEALVGKQCYNTLVFEFNITDVECLKYALSKGLGFGIVVGGGIVKIPQIVKIVSSQSARGLSLSAYVLETASYAINLAYSSRNEFPFSTYGENLFLTIQNVIITLLILHLSGQRSTGAHLGGIGGKPLTSKGSNTSGKVLAGLAVTVASGFVLWSEKLCPLPILALLQAATLPLSLISKAPQIISNHRYRSTGNLSAFAVFNALLGCVARLFTTKQEVDDPLIFWGFAGAALLNAVLAAQMIVYWKSGEEKEFKVESRGSSASEKSGATTPDRMGILEGGTGKRWARKLD